MLALPTEPYGQIYVGLKGPVSDMYALLTSRSEPVQAVTVCGPAGLGKFPCSCSAVTAHADYEALHSHNHNWCAGKATLAVTTARHMIAQARWENAYFADLRMCVSASEAGFQLLSGAPPFSY